MRFHESSDPSSDVSALSSFSRLCKYQRKGCIFLGNFSTSSSSRFHDVVYEKPKSGEIIHLFASSPSERADLATPLHSGIGFILPIQGRCVHVRAHVTRAPYEPRTCVQPMSIPYVGPRNGDSHGPDSPRSLV